MALGDTKVVVVGGGFAGTAAAKLLDEDFDVTLIEKRENFFYNIASLRAAVRGEEWADKIFIPYDNLLERGEVVRDAVAEVSPEAVFTEGGDSIEYDYLVLATGSSYAYPAKPPFDETALAKKNLARTSREVRDAKRILLIGGGPVGVELAGEIKDLYPEKSVTLIHSSDALISGPYKPGLGEKLLEQLQGRGVRVVLGEKFPLEDAGRAGVPETRTWITDKGTTVESDLHFVCFGVEPNSSYLPGDLIALDGRGQVKVDEHLRARGHDRIFAVGDLTDVNEPKMANPTGKHAKVVAKNIAALSGGDSKPDLESYEPGSSAIVISLGQDGGASQLPLFGGLVLGG